MIKDYKLYSGLVYVDPKWSKPIPYNLLVNEDLDQINEKITPLYWVYFGLLRCQGPNKFIAQLRADVNHPYRENLIGLHEKYLPKLESHLDETGFTMKEFTELDFFSPETEKKKKVKLHTALTYI